MNLTLDEILHNPDGLDKFDDPHAMIALAIKLQSAASILVERAFLSLSAGYVAASSPPSKPEADRLISINDGAQRLNKHRSWMDRHGRRLGIVICDPSTGRALGCSTRAIERFLSKPSADAAERALDFQRAREAMR